jgi:O-antigen/teichoic acid export membrane protein
MLIALPLLWLQAWFDMNLELARARLQPARYGIAAGLRAVSAITLGTALVTLKLGAFAPLLGLATGYVLGGMTLQALGWKTCRVRLVTPVLKQLLRYGLPLAATLALSYVVSSSDRFLIAYYLGEQAAGIYAASYDMVSQFLVMLMMIINMAAYPLVITALEQSGAEAARVQLARNLWLLLAASVPATLGMVLFAPQIASLVLGKSFRQAGTVIIPWIAAATLLAGVRSYYFDLAFQLGKQTIGQLWVVGSSAVVNFVLNMVLIPRTGMLGAAWATIAAYAVALLLSVLLGRRAFTVPLNWRGAGQVLLAAAAMVACWYLLPSGETLWSVAGQITCVVLIYCTTLFLLHTHWRHRFPFAMGGRRE